MKEYCDAFYEVFVDQDSDEFRQISELIRFRRQNQLTFIKQISKRPENYIHCQRHHIVPKIWFQRHGREIDDSDRNTILLRPDEHVRIHSLMRDYFRKTGDEQMMHAMANAVSKLAAGFKSKLRKVLNFDGDCEYIMKLYEENQEARRRAMSFAQRRFYANMSPEERKTLAKKRKDYADSEPEDHKRARVEKLKEYFRNMSEEEKQNRSEKCKKAWKNIPDDKKIKIGEKISQRLNSRTPEQKCESAKKTRQTKRRN